MLIVIAAAIYLFLLGAVALMRPAAAARFLSAFAGSRRLHYLELAIRALVGGAFIIGAPRLAVPAAFELFGWLLIITSAVVLVMPWHWHRRFAQSVVPRANRHLTLIGVGALVLAAVVGAGVMLGNIDRPMLS